MISPLLFSSLKTAALAVFTAALITACGVPAVDITNAGGDKRTHNSSPGDDAVISTPPTTTTPTTPTTPTTIPNTLPNPQTSPTPTVTADCYKGTEFACKIEFFIFQKTNAYRASSGKSQLTLDSKIAFVSRDWSAKQASRGFIGHSGFPSQRNAFYRTEFGAPINLGGENVAMFSGKSSDAEDDAAAEKIAQRFSLMWWNSSGHRANMLRSNFKVLGVGVHKSNRGSWYATQIFD